MTRSGRRGSIPLVLLATALRTGPAAAQAHDAAPLGPDAAATCEQACNDTVCGWAQDCFCAFCDAGLACIDGRCREMGGFADLHEPDDDPARAHAVAWPDEPDAQREMHGLVGADDPMDWFSTTPAAMDGTRWRFEATLAGPARDRDLDLAVCYRCDRGDPAEPAGPGTDAFVELDAPIPGARCFASLRPWGHDERIALEPACDSDTEAGRVTALWIAVWPAGERDAGTPYRLTIRVGEPPANCPVTGEATRGKQQFPGTTERTNDRSRDYRTGVPGNTAAAARR
jgi:hypothetical protein